MKVTNRTLWVSLAGGLVLAAPAFAQRVDNYRAQIRGAAGTVENAPSKWTWMA